MVAPHPPFGRSAPFVPHNPGASRNVGGMLPCVTCGHGVAANAKRCPSCGAKRPAPSFGNLLRALVGLAFLIIVLVAVFGGFKGAAAKPADAATSAAAVAAVGTQWGSCMAANGVSTVGAVVTTSGATQNVTLTDGAKFTVHADGTVENDNSQADADSTNPTTGGVAC